MVSSGEYNQFALKSVCGWLKIQLTGNGEKVKSIKLKGNNGEQVAGQLANVTAQDVKDMLRRFHLSVVYTLTAGGARDE